jgi:hypothetical protein
LFGWSFGRKLSSQGIESNSENLSAKGSCSDPNDCARLDVRPNGRSETLNAWTVRFH